jgi:hypothetical protein
VTFCRPSRPIRVEQAADPFLSVHNVLRLGADLHLAVYPLDSPRTAGVETALARQVWRAPKSLADSFVVVVLMVFA